MADISLIFDNKMYVFKAFFCVKGIFLFKAKTHGKNVETMRKKTYSNDFRFIFCVCMCLNKEVNEKGPNYVF